MKSEKENGKEADDEPLVKWKREYYAFLRKSVEYLRPKIQWMERRSENTSELPQLQYEKFKAKIEEIDNEAEKIINKLEKTAEAKQLKQLEDKVNKYIDRVWETKSI